MYELRHGINVHW